MAEKWPTWQDVTTAPCGFNVINVPGRRTEQIALTRAQYEQARRAIEAQEELIQALTAAILAFRLATMRDHTAAPLIAEWEAVLRRVAEAEDA